MHLLNMTENIRKRDRGEAFGIITCGNVQLPQLHLTHNLPLLFLNLYFILTHSPRLITDELRHTLLIHDNICSCVHELIILQNTDTSEINALQCVQLLNLNNRRILCLQRSNRNASMRLRGHVGSGRGKPY